MHANFSLLQYGILAGYMLLSVGVGLWFARRQKDVVTYFLAERSAPAWAVAISILSADTTAISYLGCAAIVFSGDLQLMLATFVFPFAAVFVSLVFIPYLVRRNVFTVYEYLERRFNPLVRTLGSALFLLMRGSHLAVALYAAALVLAQVVGTPIWAGLLILGGLTTFYTMFGGMKAVLWTDVIQFFVLSGGLLAVLVGVSQAFHWDLALLWRAAAGPVPPDAPWNLSGADAHSHLRLFNFSANFTRMSTWAVVISMFLQGLGSYGCDQVLVQRYLAAGSRRQMVKSLVGSTLIQIPSNLMLYGTGVFLLAYYSHFLHSPGREWLGGLTDSNRVMAHYLIHGLPGALGATVIAGLFAGTMSSFSAGLNSLSTATFVDFLTRFGRAPKGERAKVRTAKLVTCGWGLVVMLSAGFMGGGGTIFQIVNRVFSPFAGPLLGLFLLGMLSRRANSFGAVAGALIGAGATVYVTYFTPLHWMWYFVVGSLGGMVSGYLLSFLPLAARWPRKSLEPPGRDGLKETP